MGLSGMGQVRLSAGKLGARTQAGHAPQSLKIIAPGARARPIHLPPPPSVLNLPWPVDFRPPSLLRIRVSASFHLASTIAASASAANFSASSKVLRYSATNAARFFSSTFDAEAATSPFAARLGGSNVASAANDASLLAGVTPLPSASIAAFISVIACAIAALPAAVGEGLADAST